MALKTSDLAPIQQVTSADLIQIIDSEDFTMSPLGTNKKITGKDFIQSSIVNIDDHTIPALKIAADPTFIGDVTLPNTTNIGSVLSSEIGFLDGVTSNIQVQLNSKAPINDPTFTGVVTLPANTTIGEVLSTEIASLTGISGNIQDLLDLKANLESPTFTGTVGGITKSMVGLGNVDNTSDLSKPISTLTQNALNAKAPINNPTFTGTVNGINKTMVGLSQVNNTSDLDKPISTLTQNALNAKAPINNPTFTGTVNGVSKAMVGLGNVDNTSDEDKPLSLAARNALALKADIYNTKLTGVTRLSSITVDGNPTTPTIVFGNNPASSDLVQISRPSLTTGETDLRITIGDRPSENGLVIGYKDESCQACSGFAEGIRISSSGNVTVSGNITLDEPIANNHAATKYYVDSVLNNPSANLLIGRAKNLFENNSGQSSASILQGWGYIDNRDNINLCGYNSNYRFGGQSVYGPQTKYLPDDLKVAKAYCNRNNLLAVTTNGQIYGTGLNNYNQLGAVNKTEAYETGLPDVLTITKLGNDPINLTSPTRGPRTVAINGTGTRVAVGVYDSSLYFSDGYVKVYDFSFDEWVQVGSTLEPPTNAFGQNNGTDFGWCVSMSDDGETLVVGAPNYRISGTTVAGAAFIYKFRDNDWELVYTVEGTTNNERLGFSIALNDAGDRVAIGSSNTGATVADRVRVFYDTGSNDIWSQLGNDITPPATSSNGAWFAASIAFNEAGDKIAISCSKENANRGIVYTYSYSGSSWVSFGNITGWNNYWASAYTGYGISYRGNFLAVTYPYKGRGLVIVWTKSGNNWIRSGDIIYTPKSTQSIFGSSVSINSTGTRVIVGGSGGIVYVFDRGTVSGKWRNTQRTTGINGLRTTPYGQTAVVANADSTVFATAYNVDYILGRGRFFSTLGRVAQIFQLPPPPTINVPVPVISSPDVNPAQRWVECFNRGEEDEDTVYTDVITSNDFNTQTYYALDEDGNLYSAGRNVNGACVTGAFSNIITSSHHCWDIDANNEEKVIKAVSVGGNSYESIAILTETPSPECIKHLYCAGYNGRGQLAQGNTTNSPNWVQPQRSINGLVGFINSNTTINIMVDTSGSNTGTANILLKMFKGRTLRNYLLQFYNNDINLYNQRVRIFTSSGERAFGSTMLAKNSNNGTRVINLVFIDESSGVYNYNTPTTPYTTDIAALKNYIATFNGLNTFRGAIFQIGGNNSFKTFLQNVENGTGNFTSTNLVGQPVKMVYNVTDGGTQDYYANLIEDTILSFDSPDLVPLEAQDIEEIYGLGGDSYGGYVVRKTDGSLWGWGYNTTIGIFGDKTTANKTIATQIWRPFSREGEKAINFFSTNHTNLGYAMVLTDAGKVYAAGYNSNGRMGIGNVQVNGYVISWTEVVLPYEEYIVKDVVLSNGSGPANSSTIFVLESRATGDTILYGCGYNLYGELGISNTYNIYTPQIVDVSLNITNDIKSIMIQNHGPNDGAWSGGTQTTILTNNGSIYMAGYNMAGMLDSSQPWVKVEQFTKIRSI